MPTNPNVLPPPPTYSPLADRNGLITPEWQTWFTQFYMRAGGAIAPTTNDVTTLAIFDDSLPSIPPKGIRDDSSVFDDLPIAAIAKDESGGFNNIRIPSVIQDESQAFSVIQRPLQTITLTSDVTGSGTASIVTTIANNAVTNAKLAQMAANTIKGNNTAGSVNAADLTVAQTKTLLGVTTVGTAAVGQIPGTATNDSASAGNVGEESVSTILSGSPVSLTSGVATNITSIPLTAGDWEVWAMGYYAGTGSTTITNFDLSLSTTSATRDTTVGRRAQIVLSGATPFAAASPYTVCILPYRFSVSGSTTVYLVDQSQFGASTLSGYGILKALRMR